MLRSRVGLALAVCLSFFSVTGLAYHDSMMGNDGMSAYARGCGGNVHCFMVKAHRHAGVWIPKHRICVSRHAYAVCTKYVYSITPMHRDKACSQWEWRSFGGHHHRYHHSDWKR